MTGRELLDLRKTHLLLAATEEGRTRWQAMRRQARAKALQVCHLDQSEAEGMTGRELLDLRKTLFLALGH